MNTLDLRGYEQVMSRVQAAFYTHLKGYTMMYWGNDSEPQELDLPTEVHEWQHVMACDTIKLWVRRQTNEHVSTLMEQAGSYSEAVVVHAMYVDDWCIKWNNIPSEYRERHQTFKEFTFRAE